MVPGDIIEWIRKYPDDFVGISDNEELWSTPMKKWVPIGSGIIHTLISIDDEQITWMNEEGCFRARRDDTTRASGFPCPRPVLPRAQG